MAEFAGEFSEAYRQDIERVRLIVNFYRMLNQKYCINHCEVNAYLAQVQSSIPFQFDGLKHTLSLQDPSTKSPACWITSSR